MVKPTPVKSDIVSVPRLTPVELSKVRSPVKVSPPNVGVAAVSMSCGSVSVMSPVD